MDEQIIEEEKTGFFSWLKNKFSSDDEEPEEPKYERRLLDSRIEKYLDQNFNSYVEEFRMVTQLDIEQYETRYTMLTERIVGMKDYMLTAEAKIAGMDRAVAEIKKISKKK